MAKADRVTPEEVAALEEQLGDAKEERDTLEQRVIRLTSQIRELEEMLGEIYLARKS